MASIYRATSRAPWTLTHWDSRLDNVLIRSGPNPEIVTFDWQTPARGQGLRDLAHFIATTHIPNVSRADAWAPLVTEYYEELSIRGIFYARADFDRDLRIAAVHSIRTAMSVLASLDFTNERGPVLASRFLEAANFVAEYLDLPGLLREEFPD